MNITIIGAGAFGHALTLLLQEHNKVTSYDIMTEWIEALSKTRQHPVFHKEHKINDNVSPTTDLKEALANPDLIILAVPAQAMQKACEPLKEHINSAPILNVAKGIDLAQDKTMNEVIKESFPNNEVSTLAGGMLAHDIVEKHPTGATVGCSATTQAIIEGAFKDTPLDLQFTNDLQGVDLAGSLKNILAIGAGIAEAFSASTRAMVVVHLAKELEEFAINRGANRTTFDGTYCWWGDIFTTAFGNSRNRWFGELRGKGLPTKDILKQAKEEHKTVEGVHTLLCLKDQINSELLRKLYEVVHEDKEPAHLL